MTIREIIRPQRYLLFVLLCSLLAAACAPQHGREHGAADPEASRAWNDKSVELNQAGRYHEAAEAADRAIRYDPKNAFAWNNKCVALIGVGNHAGALEAADRSLELMPNNALAWSNKGVVLRLQGRYDEALAATEQALKLEPRNARIWYNKACYAELKNSREDALESLSRAFLLDGRLKAAAGRELDLEGLWNDPEFKKLVGSVSEPSPWSASGPASGQLRGNRQVSLKIITGHG